MKNFMSKSPSSYGFGFLFWSTLFLRLLQRSQAQTNTTTEPNEASAVNAMFLRWNLSPTRWNISGNLCSGSATDNTTLDDQAINPAIKCNCTASDGTVCHVTKLKVYDLSLTGAVPDELRNLTFLTNLNLSRNSLTGPLPAFIGNLSEMQYLDFGINALSGPLPRELGNLENLLSLGLGSNFFSGSLPAELGNLTNLEQFYIDSSGVSGEIPSTFANLRNMQIMWASDNNFTGQIPDFIGNWTKLRLLRFQGNSFVGSIPSSFLNLTLLTDLRISDVSNGSSSLEFIKNMKALDILILRNNRIFGTIPSDIGEYRNLRQLDLSFNNITGQLPSALFNLSLLIDLFLGNNSLSGTLPSQKSTSLDHIDLSYNELSGSFPSWVSEQGLELNLVANNFMINSSINSILPTGLDCLQRNFSCNQGQPNHSSFAINCGGEAFRSSTGIEFETETAALEVASYYVPNTNKWAVSSVGRIGKIASTSFTILGTLEIKLLQSARMSPGSLRYYGLGLRNGQYIVNLRFSELTYSDDLRNWWSRGRRVFDIYLQGNRVEKDFDIKKEAAGVSFREFQKNFNINISDNFLEIHLFWAGKGTCCIPNEGNYGPLISAISVAPDSPPTSNLPPATSSSKANKTGLVVGIVVAVIVLSFLSIAAIFILRRRKRLSIDDDEEFLEMATRPNTFNYAELRAATEDFTPSNKLGEGGFGPVYKGTLADGRMVAVKQLSVASHQGKCQFMAEIATLSAVRHRNLVKLYGCCIEGDKRLLVYEYLENRSLDQALFGKSDLHLDWPTRYGICLGTARGLAYLHEESRLRIVHRDVKASNILLDAHLIPKISDFGLAKLYDDTKTHIITRVAGTIGYLAPEYAMRGHLTEKADVFGFGVISLEILSGRLNSDSSLDEEKIYLLEWAWHLYENNRDLELVDSTLSNFDEGEAIRVLGVALLCTQAAPMMRPSMSRVVAMLSGDIEVSTVTSRPSYLTEWHFNDISSFMNEDNSSMPTERTNNSQHTSSSTTGIVSGTDLFPVDALQPM